MSCKESDRDRDQTGFGILIRRAREESFVLTAAYGAIRPDSLHLPGSSCDGQFRETDPAFVDFRDTSRNKGPNRRPYFSFAKVPCPDELAHQIYHCLTG
jgi:hypothetical protein